MRTLLRIATLMAAALFSCSLAHADPRPKRWFKDWKWWVGEAFIAGIMAADAHSSVTARANCPACNETNFFLGKHPSTGALAGMAGAGFGIQTTLHILSWKYCPDEHSRWWRAASYSLVPGVAAASIPGIVHNYGLSSQTKTASPSSMTFGGPHLTISPTAHFAMPRPFEGSDWPSLISLDHRSACGHGRFCLAGSPISLRPSGI
jgi:hypothetical protein